MSALFSKHKAPNFEGAINKRTSQSVCMTNRLKLNKKRILQNDTRLVTVRKKTKAYTIQSAIITIKSSVLAQDCVFVGKLTVS